MKKNYLKNYIQYCRGSIPLIISVPHGGEIRTNIIPDRQIGILGIDKNTIKLTLDLIKNIKKIFLDKTNLPKSPSYIISKIHRSKIDLNRKKFEAYNRNSKLAKKIYRLYHKKIEEYLFYNLEFFEQSLLIDIHGFEKDKRPEGFRDVEIILGTNNLRTMYSEVIPKKNWSNSLRGRIIRKLCELDVPIAPGHQIRREYVLKGGYITKKYGASNIKNSRTMQIEFSDRLRLCDDHLRNKVITTLAEIIYDEFG